MTARALFASVVAANRMFLAVVAASAASAATV